MPFGAAYDRCGISGSGIHSQCTGCDSEDNSRRKRVSDGAAGRGGIFCSSHTAEESGCLYASDYL